MILNLSNYTLVRLHFLSSNEPPTDGEGERGYCVLDYIQTDENVNFVAYGDVLHEVSSIISIYDSFDIIIGGDLNVDYSRLTSRNLNLLKCFVSQEELVCATLPILNNNYTRIDSRNNKSFIDHFLVSNNVNYCNVSVSHDGNNLSDHEPVTLHVNYHVTKILEGRL